MANYDIYFNSGEAGEVSYSNSDKVNLIQFSNTDQDYYQNGVIIMYNEDADQIISDSVRIYIDSVEMFTGHIGGIQQTIDQGRKKNIYSIIGETYDLFRYSTDYNVNIDGTTAYIASSLVSTYASGITFGSPTTSGTVLTQGMTFNNESVGECLKRLIAIDGYKFYVKGGVCYYHAPTTANFVQVTEPDIIEMSPIEQSDEDLINYCTVIGGTGYSSITNVSQEGQTPELVPSGLYIAQRIKAIDVQLKGVNMYLGRSTGTNSPDPLNFILLEDTSDNPNINNSVEWSDEISFNDSDVPYPPAYTGYKEYDDPKISGLIVDDYYWMIMYHTTDSADIGTEYTMVSGHFDTAGDEDEWDYLSTNATIEDSPPSSYLQLKLLSGYDNGTAWISKVGLVNYDNLLGINIDVVNLYSEAADYGKNARIAVYLRSGTSGEYGSWICAYSKTNPSPGTYTLCNIGRSIYGDWAQFALKVQAEGIDLWNCYITMDRLNMVGLSGNSNWYYIRDPGSSYSISGIRYSWDQGTNWSSNATCPSEVPSGSMRFKLGWSSEVNTASASNQTSIDLYGQYYKRIEKSTISTQEEAEQLAEATVANSDTLPKKGTMKIEGTTSIGIDYAVSCNLANFGINGMYDIKAYTQTLDHKGGFTTSITYGKHEFDPMKKIADLEGAVGL